jgi:hypothetical protein
MILPSTLIFSQSHNNLSTEYPPQPLTMHSQITSTMVITRTTNYSAGSGHLKPSQPLFAQTTTQCTAEDQVQAKSSSKFTHSTTASPSTSSPTPTQHPALPIRPSPKAHNATHTHTRSHPRKQADCGLAGLRANGVVFMQGIDRQNAKMYARQRARAKKARRALERELDGEGDAAYREERERAVERELARDREAEYRKGPE